MAAADTLEWAMRRLPDIGRQTLRTLSASERIIPYGLRLLRRLTAFGIVAALGLAVFKPDFSSESAIGRFALRVEDNPWPYVGIGVFVVVVLSNFIRKMDPQ
jgi:hypothetical protein